MQTHGTMAGRFEVKCGYDLHLDLIYRIKRGVISIFQIDRVTSSILNHRTFCHVIRLIQRQNEPEARSGVLHSLASTSPSLEYLSVPRPHRIGRFDRPPYHPRPLGRQVVQHGAGCPWDYAGA